MKTKFVQSILVLFMVSSISFSQNPHFVRDSAGISVMTGPADWYYIKPSVNQGYHYDSMKTMGVDYLYSHVDNIDQQMGLVQQKGFRIMPVDVTSGGVKYNWLQYYCDAKYSEWEAEGTDPAVGYATLERDKKRTEIITNEGIVRVNPAYASTRIDSMIFGPYYWQEVDYRIKRSGDPDTLWYDAEFKLKLEKNLAYPWHDTTTENLSADICIIQVMQDSISVDGGWHIASTITIMEDTLTRADFAVLGQTYTKLLRYNLLQDSFEDKTNLNQPMNYTAINSVFGLRKLRRNIEFKVIWLGNPRYLLSVNKIIVSDQRGRDLVADIDEQFARKNIKDQAKLFNNTNYITSIIGQYGIDEPASIDNFEPIRIVAQTVRNHGHQLYLNFMGFWDGTWDNRFNPYGTNHISVYNEFTMRTDGLVNIWATPQLYDVPYNDTIPMDPDKQQYYKDWRLANIDIAANNCKWASEIDSMFGIILQVSAQKNLQANLRDPKPHEILYLANLALMHGAKFFDLYTYFAQNLNPASQLTYTGIVEGTLYTPKWFMWRDTLKPRLKGLMGKTLKHLKPDTQYVSVKGISYLGGYWRGNPQGYKYIENIRPTNYNPTAADTFGWDMGFFNHPYFPDKKYFMILNRHYSSVNKLTVKLRQLEDYTNWNLFNYVDGTNLTLLTVNDTTTFLDTLLKGDAILYSIAPVVKYGGTIAYTDTVTDEILKGPLSIASGATLYIDGVYYAYADITIENGGSLVVLPGSSLYFYDSTSLFNKGNLIANGTAQDSILISFGWPNANKNNGIKLERTSTTNELTYCKITNAYHGIEIDSVTPTIEHNRIYGNYDGMYLLNSDYEFTNYEGTKIWHNTIHNNTDAGIRLIESSPWIAGNDISGNWVGVRCLVSSGAYFGEVGEPGCNGIGGNNYGVYSWGSNVLLGVEYDPIVAGFNTIYNTEYDIIADHGSYIQAQYNCFPDFDERKILRLDSSMIDIDPMDPNCMQIGWKVATNNGAPVKILGKGTIPIEGENNLLKKAWKYFLSGKKYSARELCKEIITTKHNSKTAPLALDLLIATFAKSKDSLKFYLNSISSNNPQGYLFAYAKLKLADLVKDNYISKIDNVISTYSNTGINELALFKKFIYFFFEMKDKNQAIQVSQQMTSSFPNSELTKEVKSLLGNSVLPKKEESTTAVPKEYFLGNYPNPFNPVTTIRYSLPKAEKVNISVYDILGRKVKELVNEEKEAGRYEIQFNASNLSSGCYFYRIITKDFFKTMKMLMLK